MKSIVPFKPQETVSFPCGDGTLGAVLGTTHITELCSLVNLTKAKDMHTDFA